MLTNRIGNAYARIYQLMEWKKYREALEEAQALIRETPDDADAYAVLSQVYLVMDRHDQALHWSGEALNLDPENKTAWFVRVAAYYDSEDAKHLREALREAKRVDPYEPHYYFLEANLCNKKGDTAGAKAQLEQALELRPEHAGYLAMLGYVEAINGDDEASRGRERQALRLDTESPQVYLYLAWAADRRGEYERQLEYLKSAIRLDPENEQIRREYLEGLQKSYRVYRFFLYPAALLRKMKPWQIFVSWAVAWVLFRPLVIALIVLYLLSHWVTKLIVHVKVFGWRRRK